MVASTVAYKETEIRGKFADRIELEKFIGKKVKVAKLKQHRFRFSVLFTTGNKKGLDLQIRSHDNQPEIILKVGKHTALNRKEFKLHIPPESFGVAVDLFYQIGFKSGVVADCEDWIYIINGKYELKVSSCDGNIFCWEIEPLKEIASVNELTKVAFNFGLKPLSESETAKYWKWMKMYGNRKLDIGKLSEWYSNYLKRLKSTC